MQVEPRGAPGKAQRSITLACKVLINFDLQFIDDDSSDESHDPLVGVITSIAIDAGNTNGSLGNTPFILGDAGFEFSAPGTDNTGRINISLDLDEVSNALPWLKFDWFSGGDGSPPGFDAVFGHYRGNDRVIYWREVF